MSEDCVKINIDTTPEFEYIVAAQIDKYVDENLSHCSACTYYEEGGDIAERLLLAVHNEMVIDACVRMIELEKGIALETN